MDLEELLAPIEPDETPRAVWIVAMAAVLIIVVVAAGVVFNRSGEPEASVPLTSVTVGDTTEDADGQAPEGATASEPVDSTVPSTTLAEGATEPAAAIAAATEYISIEGDADALTEFFADIEYWSSFSVFLRNPEEIGRYVAGHDQDTDEFEVGNAVPTEDGTVLVDVDFTWQGRVRAEVTWEIGIEDGMVVYFKERPR